jgi:hypothetical protein
MSITDHAGGHDYAAALAVVRALDATARISNSGSGTLTVTPAPPAREPLADLWDHAAEALHALRVELGEGRALIVSLAFAAAIAIGVEYGHRHYANAMLWTVSMVLAFEPKFRR